MEKSAGKSIVKGKSVHYRIKFGYDSQRGIFTATIPALGQLQVRGDTFAETEAGIKEAALQYLESLHMDSKPLPLEERDLEEGIYIKIPRP